MKSELSAMQVKPAEAQQTRDVNLNHDALYDTPFQEGELVWYIGDYGICPGRFVGMDNNGFIINNGWHDSTYRECYRNSKNACNFYLKKVYDRETERLSEEKQGHIQKVAYLQAIQNSIHPQE